MIVLVLMRTGPITPPLARPVGTFVAAFRSVINLSYLPTGDQRSLVDVPKLPNLPTYPALPAVGLSRHALLKFFECMVKVHFSPSYYPRVLLTYISQESFSGLN